VMSSRSRWTCSSSSRRRPEEQGVIGATVTPRDTRLRSSGGRRTALPRWDLGAVEFSAEDRAVVGRLPALPDIGMGDRTAVPGERRGHGRVAGRTWNTRPPSSSQVEKCAAAATTELFTTRRSPGRRNVGSSRNRACVVEPQPATSSRMSSRASPRASAGPVASRSGGNWNVLCSNVTVMPSPPSRPRDSDRSQRGPGQLEDGQGRNDVRLDGRAGQRSRSIAPGADQPPAVGRGRHETSTILQVEKNSLCASTRATTCSPGNIRAVVEVVLIDERNPHDLPCDLERCGAGRIR